MNVHDGRRRRLTRSQARMIGMAVGSCPICAPWAPGFIPGSSIDGAVIYRRSNRSLTMRCETCGLHWTMTWAKINQAMRRHLALIGDIETDADKYTAWIFESVREMTEPALANETRGRRLEPKTDDA